MPQQYTFEEEFSDNLQPLSSYTDGIAEPQARAYKEDMPGQKLRAPDLQRERAASPSTNARFGLAAISLVLLFVLFLALSSAPQNYNTSILLVIFFSLIFTGAVVVINVVFNRR